MALITTFIPTFNRSALLKRAVESVLSQKNKNFQLVIYDNCSTDGTENLINEYMRKFDCICYIRHTENIGMMKNYEKIFSSIQTPYFHILSDDDYVHDDFYEDALNALQKYPELGFYAASADFVDTYGNVIDRLFLRCKLEGRIDKVSAALDIIGNFPPPSTIVFARDILRKIQPDYQNVLLWDPDFITRITLSFPVYISRKCGGVFFSHGSSCSRRPNEDLSLHCMILTKASILTFQSCIEDNLSCANRKLMIFLAYHLRSILFTLIEAGRIEKALAVYDSYRKEVDFTSVFPWVKLYFFLLKYVRLLRLLVVCARASKFHVKALRCKFHSKN